MPEVPQLHQEFEVSAPEDADRTRPAPHQVIDPFCINLRRVPVTDPPREVNPNLLDKTPRDRRLDCIRSNALHCFLIQTQALVRRSRIQKPEVAMIAPANFIGRRAGRLVPDVRQVVMDPSWHGNRRGNS